MSADGSRVAVSDYTIDVPGYARDGDRRVYLLRLDTATGGLRIDDAFRDETTKARWASTSTARAGRTARRAPHGPRASSSWRRRHRATTERRASRRSRAEKARSGWAGTGAVSGRPDRDPVRPSARSRWQACTSRRRGQSLARALCSDA